MPRRDVQGSGPQAGTSARLLRTWQAWDDAESSSEPLGLRERKKQQQRQRISDTATMMFLKRGYDEVKVAEIAAECDVSEKTVFNYFPTKESLFFDRSDEVERQIRKSLESGAGQPIVAAALSAITAEFDQINHSWRKADEAEVLDVIRRFGDLIDNTPALKVAQQAMLDRFIDVAADALARRADVDPYDPEPQIAALSVVGLWRVQSMAMRRHARAADSLAELHGLVLADVQRAAMIAEAGVNSFDAAIAKRGKATPPSFDDARRHVVAAVHHAREAWRAARAAEEERNGASGEASGDARQSHVELMKEEARRHKAEMARLKRQMAADMKRGRTGGPPHGGHGQQPGRR